MDSGNPADEDREFALTFHLCDDTMSVFENRQRNSGIIGGLFLHTCLLQDVHAVLHLCHSDFCIERMDACLLSSSLLLNIYMNALAFSLASITLSHVEVC